MRAALGLVCAIVAAWPSFAQDAGTKPQPRPVLSLSVAKPAANLKPVPRPIAADKPQPAVSVPRPMPRPENTQNAMAAPETPAAKTAALTRSPRPMPRPKALREAALAVNLPPQTGNAAADPSKPNLIQLLFGANGATKQPKGDTIASAAPAPSAAPQSNGPLSNTSRKGSVCGDRAIRGEVIKPITSKVKGCGVAEAVRVTEVSGVRLSQAVTVECGTVQALKKWIDSKMRPAFGNRQVAGLRIAAHYACRGRNNKKGARISEHGKGRALDISGFIFTDGKEWSIARDYNKQVRAAHKGACGIFGTTLGPGSDGYHEDHLHFDTASYRAGPYCR